MRRRDLMFAAGGACVPGVSGASADPGRRLPAAFFGTHLHRLVLEPGEAGRPTAWPDLAVGSLRLWDSHTAWADLAPARGRWNFARLDAYVNAAEAHGAKLLYTFGVTPRWASARPDEPGPYAPGCAAEPAREEDWDDYVRAVIDRYRGRIAAYELWNEPHFNELQRDRGAPAFYTGSLATMLTMARVVRRAIDTLDPAARLTTPGFVNGPDRLDMFLAGGGAALVDTIAYHFYARDVPNLRSQIDAVRSVMRRRGVGAHPLWNTEFGAPGWSSDEPLPPGVRRDDESDAAIHLARCMLVNACAGIERVCYHAWDNDRSGLVRRDGSATRRHRAWADVQRWLAGSEIVATHLEGAVAEIVLRQGDTRSVIVWSDMPQARWGAPRGWRAESLEPLGGEASMATDAIPVGTRPTRIVLAPEGAMP